MATKTTSNEALIELTVQMRNLATIVEKLEANMEGTSRTKGMKEKITIAEYNIESNKQAFKDMQEAISKVEERLGKSIVQAMSALETSITEKFSTLRQETLLIKNETDAQKTGLEKIMPYFNIAAWTITAIAGVILTLLLSGKLHVSIIP
jgi:hypothetical protein